MTESSVRTGLVWDECFLRHETGPGHPERPERISAIRRSIEEAGLTSRCAIISPRTAEREEIIRLHDAGYVQQLQESVESGVRRLDADTAVCSASYEVACLAVGSVLDAVESVLAGRCRNAFCAVRPPGHHAERDRAMGFCLLNNVALAADHLVKDHGLERVLIVDWDVHHGNGTQHLFEDTSKVFYCSLHGHPRFLYPGTGRPEERGIGEGLGYTLNIALEPGTGDAEYRRAFDETLLPAIAAYRPQFVLISAGFDAHRLDPLASLCAERGTFDWMTERLMEVAERHCEGRLVSVLEGGYHLEALAECVTSHLQLLMSK